MNRAGLGVLLLVFFSATPNFANSEADKAKLDSIRVSFEAKNVTLREALQNLVAQTSLQIVYNDGLVNGLKVSCACTNVTLRQALEELLKPTPLTFEAMPDGQIVIIKRRANLKGYIKAAESGETLPYANVMLKGSSQGTSSNVNGYFVLVNVPAGLCTLRVSFIGYETVELPVHLTDGKETVTVKMRQQALLGEAVTVTAENLQTMEVAQEPAQIRISPKQISTLPSVGEVDIFRSLQLLPGISGVNDGSSGLYVRGGTPDQNLVLFDGMTIYHVDHFFGFISAFNTEAVKDVRVFKGGFPAKFGGRTSSIVELTGKSGSFDNFQAGGSVNLLSGSAIVQAPLSGRGAWLLSLRRSYTDFIKSDLYNKIYNSITGQNKSGDGSTTSENSTLPGPGGGPAGRFQAITATPDFYYYDLNSKLTYSLTGRNHLALSFYNGRDHLDQAQDLGNLAFRRGGPPGAGQAPTRVGTENLTKWGNTGASGNWSRVWSDRFYSSLLAAYSNYSSESRRGLNAGTDNANAIFRAFGSSETNKVRDLTLRFDNEWQVHKSHRLEFGTWLSRTNATVRFTANDSIDILRRDDEAEQAAFYVQDKWQVFRPLELTLGLRATSYAPTQKTYYEPRASLRLNLRAGLSLKGAWGEYHQFVNRITNENVLEGNRDFWLLADERLKPGFAEHKILGATYENHDYVFDVEAYHKDLDGVAEFSQRFRRSPEARTQDLFFLGTGVAKGIEFLAQKKSGTFNGWASYTLAKVEYKIFPFNNGEAYPADQDRRHELKLVGNYGFGKWNLAATWVLASGAPYTAPGSQYAITLLDGSRRSYIHVSGKNAHRLPAYHRMDVSLSRQFTGALVDWNLGISIFNLYDHKNVWYREYLLDTNPVVVREVTTLGFVPTVTLQANLK
jgi:outer membrane receptor for ferrienterochelin and colicin